MKRRSIPMLKLRIPLGQHTITIGASWWVAAPAGLWAIGAIYVPILAPFFNVAETWMVAIIITLLSAVSLLGHAGAHLWAARITGSDRPDDVPLYPLGDAAQIWPTAPTAWREAWVALAGPGVSSIVAALAYLGWNGQFNPYLNVITLFLVFFNGGLAAFNLTPVFPLDGGRLGRAILWGLLARPALATRLGRRPGFLFAALLAGWGLVLIAQQARFSWQTGSITLVIAGLMLIPLTVQPLRPWTRPAPTRPFLRSILFIRGPIALLLILTMLGLSITLVPTNNGLEAPGVAPSVTPMVRVPAPYRYPSTGDFLLTTVFSQTPITVGEWLVGQLSPVIDLVPPERIVPPDTTVQEQARQNFQMLDESQLLAVAVGLRLAGFEIEAAGLGARVLSVLAESPAHDLLQPGDVIIALNGEAIGAASDLIGLLRSQAPQETVRLQIERAGRRVEVATPLIPAPEPEQPPRIGIAVADAGFAFDLPVPVEIVPQKIAGGPSAGLIFALAVYDRVTPEDLTGGRIIAGTGTINLDGTVGPIGSVQQKVAAAEFAGAEYFLSPPENYADAQAVARRITVVQVATAEEAIRFLRNLPPRGRSE